MGESEHMHSYTICNQTDSELFCRQCEALRRKVDGLEEKDYLEDVDGTMTRIYTHPLGKVTVKNDCQIDALYVVSDFDLMPYFS